MIDNSTDIIIICLERSTLPAMCASCLLFEVYYMASVNITEIHMSTTLDDEGCRSYFATKEAPLI